MRQNTSLFNLLFFNTVGIVIVKLAINLSTFFSLEEAYHKSVCTIIISLNNSRTSINRLPQINNPPLLDRNIENDCLPRITAPPPLS